jgi:hypothetical protein
VSLVIGPHQLELKHADYIPHQGNFTLSEAGLTLPPITLTPLPVASSGPASGSVMVFFAGRIGDQLSVDGTPKGSLPAKVELTAGPHTFLVSGEAGAVTVQRSVVLQSTGTTVLHLDQ